MKEEKNLPKNWKHASLVEDLPFIKTGVPEYKGKKKYFSTGSIKGDIIIEEGDYSFYEKPSRANRIGIKGDVLQARMKGTDKCILIDSNLDGQLFSTGFFQLRPIEGLLNGKYIFHYLTSLNFNRVKDELCSGSTQSALNDEGARKIFIPIPPIKEQENIVSKIEELLSELENGKQQLQIAQQQLKVYRQSLLKWAFDKYYESDFVKLASVCNFITKGTTPTKDNLTPKSGNIPFLKVYNLTFDGTLNFLKDPNYVSDETHNNFLKRSKVIPGDILMNIVGPPLGKVSIVPYTYPEWNINQAIVRFSCMERIYNKYLMYFLLSENTIRNYSKKAKATAGQFNLTLEICRDIEIPLPIISEQIKMVSELESKLTICDKIEETISQSLQQAETLRQSILKKAFEGKLIKFN